MGYFYHKDRGFLHSGVHKKIPEDAHPITDEEHAALLEGHGNGFRISHDDNGFPCLKKVAPMQRHQLIARARADRDMLLLRCDWTQLPDVPTETSQKYKAYRQALRDVPSQQEFPDAINWPIEPGTRDG